MSASDLNHVYQVTHHFTIVAFFTFLYFSLLLPMWVFLRLFTVTPSKYLSLILCFIINHKIFFCMEDKVQHPATVCSFVWVSTVSPPLLQSRNLDLDREQTPNSNGALTLKWAEVRTVLSWRGDGTQARSPCSLEYTGWHGQRGPAPGGLQTGRLISDEEDGGWIYCLQCQGDFAQFHKLIRDGADVNCRGGEPLREAITNSHVIIWTQVVTIITIVTIIMMMISCWTVPGWTWSSGTRMGGQPCTWLAGTTRLVVRGMEDAPNTE